ncbi:MAG TPA: TlpA family protein disulfide reductase, partial [Rhizobiales bacterium]|nr:TlpA family protein disulfide reductase [Hyphomicrobiales bacterium]
MTNDTTPKKSSAKTGLILAGFAALIAGAFAVYSINGSKGNNQGGKKFVESSVDSVVAAPEGITKALAVGKLSAFLVHKIRRDVQNLSFKDGEGNDLSLEKWKGRVVLLNLWATWCGPCRKEMPHLAELQQKYGG